MLIWMKQQGATLTGQMVSLAIGLTLTAAIMGYFVSVTAQSRLSMRQHELRHEVNSIALLIERDLRRAGHNGGAVDSLSGGANINPFNSTAATLLSFVDIYNADDDVTSMDCVTFSFDLDHDSVLDTNEYFGYRFNEEQQTVEYRDSALLCDQSGWKTLSDHRKTQVNDFQLISQRTLAPGAVSLVTTVELVITASVIADPELSTTLRRFIKVRNDYY